MNSSVEVRLNKKNLNKLIKNIDEQNKVCAYVGVLDTAPAGLAEIAYKNEFGATGASSDLGHDIPERSFIRSTVENEGENIIDEYVKYMAEESFWESYLKDGGVWLIDEIATDLANKIAEYIDLDSSSKTPNAPYTLQRKTGSTPLKDKGVLSANIMYRKVTE